MDSQNIKVYLAISGALIVLFILVLIIPFSKKTTNNNLQPTTSVPFPTSVQTGSSPLIPNSLTPNPYSVPADFTGVSEEELPPQILEAAL